MDFGRVLGGFWEAKILDFRTFFDVFSMSFFERGSEGEKIGQDEPTRRRMNKFGGGFRHPWSSWGKERIGVSNTSDRIARKNVKIGQL